MLLERIRAHVHATWHFYRLSLGGLLPYHRIITYSVDGRTVAVDCSCGRSFGLKPEHRRAYLGLRAACPHWYETTGNP